MKERIYYEINEQSARTAHEMMSMREYKEGSKTREYRNLVDNAYDLAGQVEEKRPLQSERAYKLAERYSRKMAEYFNKDSAIGCRCPSVLISGTGNFPVKKKEKQVQAWENNYQFYQETQKLISKIKSILYGKDIIKSGDSDAVERLEEKLAGLKEDQERMKVANKFIRLKNVEKGNEGLTNMGYSEKEIKELREPDFCGRVGYPPYMLQNNNANIHRVEGRLKQLKAAKERGSRKEENRYFRVVENTEIMRLQIFFDEKPVQDIRSILKKNGFKWSSKNGCWQRQLTDNARYSLERIKKEIKTDE
ncbi:hypothetical protein DW833_08715 [Anaerobutyricum hallii]|uniref:Uncharacterized protein n=1 Tax=Anaerobutyricum hallii TaxID=39488 RepID=A0A414B595_9FIRM|nr:hypothetical protein [Anaerobutyricum hallii]RHC64136.1 hypothetical protein DW833_08715 [Anaerobutyricum hallii]